MPKKVSSLPFLFTTVLFFLLSSLKAQEVIDFDIKLAGFTIGQMNASKTFAQDTTIYRLDSKVSFWLFGTIKVDYHTEVKYHEGTFINSVVSSKTNRGNYISRIWLEENQYKIDANGYKYEHKDSIKAPIHHSAVRLFFEEPKGIKVMMAENLGKFSQIKSHGEGIYTTHIEGDENKYYYQDGKMQKVSMHNPIKNYEVKRRE